MFDRSSERSDLAVVIMAAGKGTRMNDPERAKVMFTLGERPMIAHVIDRAHECGAASLIVVIGFKGETVRDYLLEAYPNAPLEFTEQKQQLGTGHAVMQAESLLSDFDGNVLVLSGDVPMLSTATLQTLIQVHQQAKAVGTVLTVKAPDPTGYGRVLRDANGAVSGIVEHKDATEEERQVDEINAGVYVFNSKALFQALPRIGNENVQGEYYLPDVLSVFLQDKLTVAAHCSDSFNEIQGINTVDQLAQVEATQKIIASR